MQSKFEKLRKNKHLSKGLMNAHFKTVQSICDCNECEIQSKITFQIQDNKAY